jgi:predicted esterase
MKITNVIKEPVFGGTVTARLYQPITPSSNWVIWYHGMGQVGPDDGSQLNEVEFLPGFPKFAKGIRPGESTERGLMEYPFNIYAVQTEANYNFEKVVLATYIALKKKAKNLVVGGISLGGICTMESGFDFNDLGGFIKGLLNCCGSFEVSKASRMRNIPILWWHGDQDTTVKYTDATPTNPNGVRGALEASNALKALGKPVEFITLQGVGHNAWDKAFTTAPDDKSLAFVNRIFAAQEIQSTQAVDYSNYNLTIDKAIASLSALKK